eukprot:347177-Prorocentrum_minimum.AAC.1
MMGRSSDPLYPLFSSQSSASRAMYMSRAMRFTMPGRCTFTATSVPSISTPLYTWGGSGGGQEGVRRGSGGTGAHIHPHRHIWGVECTLAVISIGGPA